MGKRAVNLAARAVLSAGIVHSGAALEPAPPREMTTIEQMATVVTDAGQAADDVSSTDDVTKKAEAVSQQLTSEAGAHPSPDADPEGGDPQEALRDLEEFREEDKLKKADKDVALGDREQVSSGDIIAPAEESEPADETWLDDDADVDDPDID
ncbi:MAG: hypothetical protein M3Z75_03410 [Actinomycetota bacterium]|nr:hypothetical protein [Actinomycetota bacterium]